MTDKQLEKIVVESLVNYNWQPSKDKYIKFKIDYDNYIKSGVKHGAAYDTITKIYTRTINHRKH